MITMPEEFIITWDCKMCGHTNKTTLTKNAKHSQAGKCFVCEQNYKIDALLKVKIEMSK